MLANPIRTAIIGYGVSAKIFHLPFLSRDPRFEIVAFVERSGRKSQELYPHSQCRASVETMLDLRPELVIVCSPNAQHFDHAKLCLEADCHVVAEKPLCVTVSEADQLIDLARSRQKILTIYHNRRLDGDFLTVSNIVASGSLGRIVEAEIRFDRWTPGLRSKIWKEDGTAGSGLLEDLGSHLIDQALQLWGLPAAVTARLSVQRDHSQVDDAFDLSLSYPGALNSGLQVRLKGGMLVRQAMPRFTLFGTKGSFIKYGNDPQEAQLTAGLRPGAANLGIEDESLWGTLQHQLPKPEGDGPWLQSRVATRPGNYALFHDNLARAIREGADVLVTPEQARRVIQIIAAAHASSEQGRSVGINASV